MEEQNEFMRRAIELSIDNVKNGGGPFGAVIVKDGRIVAEAVNSVTKNNDPTAHAEVNCIRLACKNLETFHLTECDIYTSCEPCPMCFGAIFFARISKIYFGNDRKDADDIGFCDRACYEDISRPHSERKIPIVQLMREEAIKAFDYWSEKADKIEY